MEYLDRLLEYVQESQSDRWLEAEAAAPTPSPTIGPMIPPGDTSSTPADYSNSTDEMSMDPTKSILKFLLLLVLSFVTLCVLMGAGQLLLRCAQRVLCPLQYQQQQEALRQQQERQYAARRFDASYMFDQGSLAKAAGLAPGLLVSERQAILESVFRDRLLSFDALEAAAAAAAAQGIPKDQEEGEKVVPDSLNAANPEAEAPPSENAMCSICLTEYTVQDKKLVQGTQCSHVFHYDCCMEWLKQHDHCPYCRMEMVSSDQFRKAAMETLGSMRMQLLPIAPMPEGFFTSSTTVGPRGRDSILPS